MARHQREAEYLQKHHLKRPQTIDQLWVQVRDSQGRRHRDRRNGYDHTMESNGQLLIGRAMAIWQLPEDQAEAVVAAFIDEFGPEAYQMLREKF